MTQTTLVLWAGLAIGIFFGASSQITGFCFYRGLHQRWSGLQRDQLKAFSLALAVALAGTHLISSLQLVEIKQSLYLTPTFSWLLLPLGGLLFGYGMHLANGCGARALVLIAQGNLRSLVVLLCLGVAAYITLTGVLAPLRIYLGQKTAFSFASPTLAAGHLRNAVTWLLVGLLSFYALQGANLKARSASLLGGLAIGGLIIAGWLTTGWLGADPFEPTPVSSLSFVAPVGDTLQYAMLYTGLELRFGTAIIFGVLVGSFISALMRGRLQLEGFEDAHSMRRYIVGGIYMGIGGVLAMGCTIGQGLSGLSTLSFSSMIAMVCIILGAKLGFITGLGKQPR